MKIKRIIINFITIILGCALAAFGTSYFLLPNKLSSGGFAGIATVIYYLFQIPMGTVIILLNIPFFVFGYIKLGKSFIFKSIFATILYSEMIDFFSKEFGFTGDYFLASIFGGILIGLGLAIVFKAEASTGGTDLIAHIAQRYSRISTSNILVIVDIIIVIVNLVAFRNIEIGLYSAIAIYIVGKMIDIVFEGINFCKMIYIISDKSETILEQINIKADKGATGLYGRGSYSKKDKTIIMCVTKRREIIDIKHIAKEIDKNAFIVIVDAREVYGLGFKS